MKLKRALLSSCIIATLTSPLSANSPPNISTNIPWTDAVGIKGTANRPSYNGVIDIMAAFNHARR